MSVNDHSYIIIGGSTKCATTSVFKYLADHPQISGSKIKESRFFWKGNYQLQKESVSIDDGIDKFDNLFVDKSNAKYRLEATPDYLYSERSAAIIHENLNNVRFLFIIRDPVDRVISWYKFAKQLNLINPTQSIDNFITEQLNLTENSSNIQYQHAVEQGRYSIYLETYIKLFGLDKIKVISYEKLVTNPLESLIEISNFIDIDNSFYKNYDFKVLNQSVKVGDAKSFNQYRNFRRRIRRAFKNIIPDKFRYPFRKIYKKVDGLYMNKATSDFEEIVISENIKKRLIEYYAKDKLIVQSIINN